MRKLLFALLAFSCLPVSARAQDAQTRRNPLVPPSLPLELPSLDLEIKSDQAAGRWRQIVINRGDSTIVAMHSIYRCQIETKHGYFITSASIEVYDSLTGSSKAIPPGAVEEILAQDPSKCPGGVDAVIFADGHSEGDQGGVSSLYERRRGIYKAIGEVIPLLDRITNEGVEPTKVADLLLNRSKSISKIQTNEEHIGRTMLYKGVESLLRGQHSMAMPSSLAAVSVPRVEEVAKINAIPREQAHAIVLRNQLQAWEDGLRAHLEPPVVK